MSVDLVLRLLPSPSQEGFANQSNKCGKLCADLDCLRLSHSRFAWVYKQYQAFHRVFDPQVFWFIKIDDPFQIEMSLSPVPG